MIQLHFLLLLLAVMPSKVNGACPIDWMKYTMGKKCYRVFFRYKSWNEAKTACRREQAILAELRDFNTNDFIRTNVGRKVWIGSYRCGEDTCFLNGKYVPYTPYAPDEPDMKSDQQSINQTATGLKAEDFAILIRPNGWWGDELKDNKYPYICEMPERQCEQGPCSPGTNRRFEKAKSCDDLYKSGKTSSGVYTVNPDGQGAFQVRCDMTITPGKGWTVFQRRVDGSVDFYRNWTEYKNGFGNLEGEFWLGLDKIHRLTASGQNVLRVDLESFENETAYANYETFCVGDESQKYNLTVDGYTGTAGDSLNYQNGMKFSTKDRDNDKKANEHCAEVYKGAWWYNGCHQSNLNGKYLRGSHASYADGVNWHHFKKLYYSLMISEMKVRPKV